MRLTRRSCPEDCRRGSSYCDHDWIDHAEVWNRDGRPDRFVSHPYGISWGALLDLVEFCKANGFEADLVAGSWYFPGASLRLDLLRAGERPNRVVYYESWR